MNIKLKSGYMKNENGQILFPITDTDSIIRNKNRLPLSTKLKKSPSIHLPTFNELIKEDPDLESLYNEVVTSMDNLKLGKESLTEVVYDLDARSNVLKDENLIDTSKISINKCPISDIINEIDASLQYIDNNINGIISNTIINNLPTQDKRLIGSINELYRNINNINKGVKVISFQYDVIDLSCNFGFLIETGDLDINCLKFYLTTNDNRIEIIPTINEDNLVTYRMDNLEPNSSYSGFLDIEFILDMKLKTFRNEFNFIVN